MGYIPYESIGITAAVIAAAVIAIVCGFVKLVWDAYSGGVLK